jgi:hypothetical protein
MAGSSSSHQSAELFTPTNLNPNVVKSGATPVQIGREGFPMPDREERPNQRRGSQVAERRVAEPKFKVHTAGESFHNCAAHWLGWPPGRLHLGNLGIDLLRRRISTAFEGVDGARQGLRRCA